MSFESFYSELEKNLIMEYKSESKKYFKINESDLVSFLTLLKDHFHNFAEMNKKEEVISDDVDFLRHAVRDKAVMFFRKRKDLGSVFIDDLVKTVFNVIYNIFFFQIEL